jgi:hypothetical protein
VFFKRDVVLAQEYLGFLLLNLFDLFLTGYLLNRIGHSGNLGQEANGAAAWIMTHYGMRGFAFYKFLLVLVVIVACEGVSLQSVRKSRVIVTVGCLIYLGVVLWECFLVLTEINGIHFHGLHPILTVMLDPVKVLR